MGHGRDDETDYKQLIHKDMESYKTNNGNFAVEMTNEERRTLIKVGRGMFDLLDTVLDDCFTVDEKKKMIELFELLS